MECLFNESVFNPLEFEQKLDTSEPCTDEPMEITLENICDFDDTDFNDFNETFIRSLIIVPSPVSLNDLLEEEKPTINESNDTEVFINLDDLLEKELLIEESINEEIIINLGNIDRIYVSCQPSDSDTAAADAEVAEILSRTYIIL